MLNIISPMEIAGNKNILGDLRDNGIDHLTIENKFGWNYVLDHTWLYIEINNFLRNIDSRKVVIMDVGVGRSIFHPFLEKHFNIDIIGVDRQKRSRIQSESNLIDINQDFMNIDSFEDGSVDLIYFLSSIEHNKSEKIRAIYQKAMRLLKKNGVFLATIALSEETHWFPSANQTNLSIDDAIKLFDITEVKGNFLDAKNDYRNNILFLRDKYTLRFQSGIFNWFKKSNFKNSDPAYIVGSVKKIKN